MDDSKARQRLKLLLGFFVYSITLCIIFVVGVFWWGATEFQKPGPLQDKMLLTVERGSGLNSIAQKLKAENIIDRPYIFIAGTRVLGAQSDLKAGEYDLAPAMSPKDIVHMLREGKTFARRFTIREGLTSYEIVRHLKGVENLSGDVKNIPSEGTLLPNTYDYQLNETRSDILSRLENEMFKTLIELCPTKIGDNPAPFPSYMNAPCGDGKILKTVRDVLTLASIVEKETAVASERTKVAGVFINRLKKGIALQTDPTVIYAITKGKHKNDGKGPLGRRLLKKDLQIDNPYNTYKYPGLPPGPIANPGKASIEAVLNPEEHDYIFFVADGTGGHAFAKTLKEHNQNVAKWRKIRRQKK